ncbi:P-loop containing nucleoside triphosphate hydrolase protein [Lasiosphaeria miniovina]|uniref:Peroxisomal ATPase PEX1 n=1 Tax=Lasiosphaeria miniovina TaxID=1954250 RepID=A0AA40DKD6_9PEZI|nr:P-loop containing nucleoside triphosphate hydrolase protein [Lasiosphaeria miniovina]KAK0706415.1 P-loop containing nucleoside triphosphate hydrolase protein [Lasiosphaeria miniovina]
MSRRPQLLRGGIDRETYQIVRRLEELDGVIYDSIKRSNSSLARQKRRSLEDSIERVLALRKDEAKADDQYDSDDAIELAEKQAAAASKAPSRDFNLLNKQIAKAWNINNTTSTSTTTTTGVAVAPETDGDSSQTPAVESATPGKEPIAPVLEPTTPGPELTTPSATLDRRVNGEPRPKKRKGTPRPEMVDRSPPTGLSIRDIAGVDDTLDRLLDEVWFPLCAGEACEKMGYRYENGVLLHGPSGCGKTALANAVAGSVGTAFIPVSAASMISGTSGESEKNIRDVFDEAIQLAPCLLFIDDIDAIAGKRESASKGMEGRIVTEIMSGMDRIKKNAPLGKNVVVLAATTRPDFLDPAIRRRFSVEIDIGMPNERAREQILRSMARGLNVADDVDFSELARLTPGYVGSDLQHVVQAAVTGSFRGGLEDLIDKARTFSPPTSNDDGLTPVQRNWLLLEDHRNASWGQTCITQAQFKVAVARVQPASKREGFSAIPDTTWAKVGALGDVRRKLEMSIIGPIKQPELFRRVGIKPAAGILLWGPPGCGKTLVAKAVANESKANFISIKGPELLNKYVGESERAVRQLFSRAKSSAPCVLFFDEMDALVPRRDDSLSDASARVVNTLLTELDGVGDRTGIYVIGATNRPDMIDEAIRRPGRLGTSIYVGLPSPEDRVDILKTLYRNTIIKAKADAPSPATEASTAGLDASTAMEIEEEEVDLERVALDPRCTGFSGADLGNLMQAAAQACLQRAYLMQMQIEQGTASTGTPVITLRDWEKALTEVKPSVKDMRKYTSMN